MNKTLRYKRIFLMTSIVCLMMVGFIVFALVQSYGQHRSLVENNAENLTKVLGGYLSADLGTTIQVMRGTERYLQSLQHKGKDEDALITTVLEERNQFLIAGAEMRMATAEGLLKYGRHIDPKNPINVTDRLWFHNVQQASPHQILVGFPIESRVYHTWMLPVSLRLSNPDGSFAGALSVTIPIQRLHDMFASLGLGKDGVISVFSDQRDVLVRYPEPKGIGSTIGIKLRTQEFLALWDQGHQSGTYETIGVVDGKHRIYSYRKLGDFPAYVIVGLSASDYLEPWVKEVWVSLLFLVLFLAITCTAVYFLWRSTYALERASEKNLTFFREASDGICILNMMGSIVEVSDSFCRMLDYSRDEMQGMHVSQWDAQIRAEELDKLVRKTFFDNERIQFESEHKKKGGQKFVVEISVVPFVVYDERFLFCTVRDITERKENERVLSNERRRLNDILEATHAGTWEWNVQTGEVVFNERWPGIIGYTLNELSPVSIDTWESLAHPEDLHISEECLKKHFSGDSAYYECEIRMKHKDGHWVWVLDRGKVVSWTDEGEPILMSGTHQDINERKLLDETQRAMEEKLRGLFALSPLGIALTDMQGRYVEFNEAFRRITGYSADELKLINYWQLTPECYKDQENHQLTLLAETSKYGPYEKEYVRKDGSRVSLSLNGMLIRGSDGHDYIWSIVEDISDRKRAEAELLKAKQAAEAANLAKSQFLATMSHEIRTPMNGILGMAQLLMMDGVNDAERLDFASTILNSGRTLLMLLNDILDFSKIEAGKLELDLSPVNPNQILQDTAKLFHENATEKGINLNVDAEEKNQSYLIDPYRVRQMLSNLTSNAIKFTAKGSVTLSVREIERSDIHAVVEFSVQDTGTGISEDKQHHLFQPFSQADNSITRQFGGTGLGLSIVRSLALKMGGDVGVESSQGEGARFWFRLRADLVDGEISPLSSPHSYAEAALSLPVQDKCILVVEDNQTNQKVIQGMLKKLGYVNYFVADNGLAGVQLVEQNPEIDLILMDVNMPVMDGYEATQTIRVKEAERGDKRRVIIALTADAFEEDRQRCFDIGMDDFLTKPVSLDLLSLALQRWSCCKSQ